MIFLQYLNFSRSQWLLAGLWLPLLASAQVPTVQRAGLSPAANARAAGAGAAVAVSFSEPMDAGTAGNVRLFSAQGGGRRTATASGSGSTLTLVPAAPGAGGAAWRPGETVQVSVPATVKSSSGVAAQPYVYQFTVAATGSGVGYFVPPAATTDPTVGPNPYYVTLGDLNGDGALDLVTADYNGGTVSIRLNDGAGGFTVPATTTLVGTNPTGVAIGDVDGDGDLDLVTANYGAGSNTASVRLNNGTGSFTAPTTTPNPTVGNRPFAVALGDVDGDGDLDLVTANYGGGTVSVRLNNGSGGFSGGTDLPVNGSPASVALGDVDGDGDLDLVTANFNSGSNTVSVRLNDGAGNFTPPATVPNPVVGDRPRSVALGDVDGDGDLDLVTANYTDLTASVRLNNGAGNFGGGSDVAVSSGPTGVVLGDVDGDGDLDLLTANYTNASNTVSVRLNDGTGRYAAPAPAANPSPNPAVGTNPISLALGDVDGDGDLDLVAANYGGGTVSVRLNQPLPPLISNLSPRGGPVGTSLTLTGSRLAGATAVAFSGTSGNVVTTGFSVNAAGTQLQGLVVPAGAVTGPLTVTTPSGTSPSSTQVFVVGAAVQRAGLSPAANARAAGAGAAVAVSFSEPMDAGTAGNVRLFSAQRGGRRTATASGSGSTLTLVPAAPGAGGAAWRPGETVQVSVPATVKTASQAGVAPYVYQFTVAASGGSGRFVPPATNPNPAVGPYPFSVALGDVDGDGDLDLVTANYSGNTVSIRLNDGAGNFTPPATNPNPTVGDFPRTVVLGDVDGDGDLDLVTANNSGGSNGSNVSVRLNNGAGNFTAPTTNPDPYVGDNPISLALGDVDGDGDLDLVVLNGGISYKATILLNNGAGSFTLPAVNPRPDIYSPGDDVALGDVDGDGDLDLVVATAYDKVSIRLNDGTGNFTAPATGADIDVRSLPYRIALGDVDGDGDLDFVTANYGSSTASVRLNDGAGNFTPPATNPNPAVGNRPIGVVLGDVDGDGDLDLLTANSDDHTVSVRLNDGAGSFTPPAATGTIAVDTYPSNLALGDVDGDGDLDLVTSNTNDGNANSGNPNASGTTSVRLNQAGQPLPVELVQFTATASGRAAVRLNWTTASEVNSARFEVERSANGAAFVLVGTVTAAGSSTTTRPYAYLDANAPTGLSYYRLRQVDQDGSSAYSPVRAVTLGGAGLTLYPNPAQGTATLLRPAGVEAATATLHDALGRAVRTYALPAGAGPHPLDVTGLPAGVYVLQVSTPQGPASLRLAVE